MRSHRMIGRFYPESFRSASEFPSERVWIQTGILGLSLETVCGGWRDCRDRVLWNEGKRVAEEIRGQAEFWFFHGRTYSRFWVSKPWSHKSTQPLPNQGRRRLPHPRYAGMAASRASLSRPDNRSIQVGSHAALTLDVL